MRRAVSCIYAILLLASLYCTNQLAGGGTETTNGINGTIASISDSSIDYSKTIAAIYSTGFRPDRGTGFAETTFINSSGTFHFDPPPENRYNLYVWYALQHQGARLPDLPADTTVGAITLSGTGTIVLIPPINSGTTDVEMIIRGSPFYYAATSGATPVIPMVPKGTYSIDISISSSDSTGIGAAPDTSQKKVTIDPEIQDTVKISIQ